MSSFPPVSGSWQRTTTSPAGAEPARSANEDAVAAAGLATPLVPGLGNAGFRGLVSDGFHVHDLAEDDMCLACEQGGPRPEWIIHNVRMRYFAHNDQFITPKHALQFWLPFLWEIEPQEFRDWLELCRVAARFQAQGQLGRGALKAEHRLRTHRWRWAGGTLEQLVRLEYPAAAHRLDDPVFALRLFRSVWQLVERACQESLEHGGDLGRMAQARALEPRVALQVAVATLAESP